MASRARKALIASVARSSPAEAAGLIPGDQVLSMDGHPLRDVIDFQFYLEPGGQTLEIERGSGRLSITLDNRADDPGIFFKDALFDRVRTCDCDCIFCFVKQLPRGLRHSLYIKDDDYRLSFLYGNFITLNNIGEEEIERIFCQHLSPLHISVHSTDPEVRARLMGCDKTAARRGLDNLRRLGSGGIETHAQLVICPGINDGTGLEQTIMDLADGYPGIASVGVVPVSMATAWLKKHPRSGLRTVSKTDSRAVIKEISVLQQRFQGTKGIGFVYAADEFYLRASAGLPSLESYDGLPQYENGIGMASSFLAAADELRHELPGIRKAAGSIYLLTGVLAAAVVETACSNLNRLSRSDFRPLVAGNRLFGPHVTVAGLLGGTDVIRAAREAGLGRDDLLLIPLSCLNNEPDPCFLDGLSLSEVDEALYSAVRAIAI